MIFHFSKTYFALALLLVAAEFSIALFVSDKIIRPFVGDVLVVALVYCFLRIFLNIDYRKVALTALLFACTIEVLQYFDYVKLLGLENNRVLSVALGRTFEWLDFVAYFAGFALIIIAEKFYRQYHRIENWN